MSRDPLADFADVEAPGETKKPAPASDPDLYPGSKRKRRAVAGAADPFSKYLSVPGNAGEEYYRINVLADMLGRKAPTIRKWERLGYLPQPKMWTHGTTHHGDRRLYTRVQIEGIVKIAKEEGVTTQNRNVSATDFSVRVRKLFKDLGT